MPLPDSRITVRRDDRGYIRRLPGPQHEPLNIEYGLGQLGETPRCDNGTCESRHDSSADRPTGAPPLIAIAEQLTVDLNRRSG
jgi:hypothetical protein